MQNAGFLQQVTFLPTSDLAQTASFYEAELALPLILDQGVCRIYRVSGDAFLGFCSNDEMKGGSAHPPAGVIITLVSDDVDGWYERLRNKGVEFESAPAYNPKFNIYHCFLRDPNGYLLEIQSFLDSAWPLPSR